MSEYSFQQNPWEETLAIQRFNTINQFVLIFVTISALAALARGERYTTRQAVEDVMGIQLPLVMGSLSRTKVRALISLANERDVFREWGLENRRGAGWCWASLTPREIEEEQRREQGNVRSLALRRARAQASEHAARDRQLLDGIRGAAGKVISRLTRATKLAGAR